MLLCVWLNLITDLSLERVMFAEPPERSSWKSCGQRLDNRPHPPCEEWQLIIANTGGGGGGGAND